ncbi:DedA family protein [Lysinibacillus sp. NPDC097287]|uniref:DedA family protein n=1 Tax=Lysinibacillus sp. NPDC097287 TaxID=3364144 RepID=UPI00380E3B79
MENWIINVMEQYGYIGIFFLITIENIFPPIPSEIILTFGGFMTTHSDLEISGVIVASTLGSLVGALVLYGIGRSVDINKLETLVSKWGFLLRLKKGDIRKANDWFLSHGVVAVFFCRFVPLIRSLISLPAGMARMPLGLFLFLTTLGTMTWNVVLVKVGAAVGDSWERIVYYLDIYADIVYGILFICLLLMTIRFVRKRRIRRAQS